MGKSLAGYFGFSPRQRWWRDFVPLKVVHGLYTSGPDSRTGAPFGASPIDHLFEVAGKVPEMAEAWIRGIDDT
jgi:hypothetical protein